MMKTKILILSLLCSGLNAGAQQAYLSREEYRDKVEAYSQILKQQHLKTFASTEARKIASTGFLPQIDIIAEGTAKAHTRHIYEKLGINTRQELLDLLMTEQQRAGSYKDALSHDLPTARQIARHIRKIWSAQGSSDLCEKRSTVGKRCPLPQGGSPAGNPYEETAATQA